MPATPRYFEHDGQPGVVLGPLLVTDRGARLYLRAGWTETTAPPEPAPKTDKAKPTRADVSLDLTPAAPAATDTPAPAAATEQAPDPLTTETKEI